MRRSEQGALERHMEESLLLCARGFVVAVGILVWTQAESWLVVWPVMGFFYGMIGASVIGAAAKIVRVWGS